MAWWQPTRILATDVSFEHETVRSITGIIHRYDCRNTLVYAHTGSRTIPTCDVSLGSLNVAMPEATDFVESLQTCNKCE